MSRILVTGGGGYIGTTLVPMLLDAGHEVRVVDRFFFGRDKLTETSGLDLVVEDTRRLEPRHFEGIDAVLDLAAISNDPSGELFQQATWAINHRARVRCAVLAKEAGIGRYILPSTCSVYGFQDAETVADEESPTNPLTTYAKANLSAEDEVLELSDDSFCVVVLRQATVFGFSPRMRFDLAINGMAYGAWKTSRLPLMRDGSQWRPMVHVRDTASAMIHMLAADRRMVGGQIFNVGSEDNVYQIGPLGSLVAETVPGNVEIEWYGDPDHRSYRVSFEKIERTGWRAQRDARVGVAEIVEALERGETDRTTETITLDWYKALTRFHEILDQIEIDGHLIDLPEPNTL
jgi:nucleoside-diphosphate-sugar epimerase